jgi:hypothetical protein
MVESKKSKNEWQQSVSEAEKITNTKFQQLY